MPKIDAREVEIILLDCLYKDEEITDNQPPPDAVVAKGIINTFAFHPGRLELHKEQVRAWLMALPHQFRSSAGGGWSFLAACEDEDGEQWGQHHDMQSLFCLGLGLNLVVCLLPREMWDVLPGGMPYYMVKG